MRGPTCQCGLNTYTHRCKSPKKAPPTKRPTPNVKALVQRALELMAQQLDACSIIDLYGVAAYDGGRQYDEAKQIATNYIKMGARG